MILPPQHSKAMQIRADTDADIARIRARTDLVPDAKRRPAHTPLPRT